MRERDMEITITTHKGHKYEVYFDPIDAELVMGRSWYVTNSKGYIAVKNKQGLLARQMVNAPTKMDVDHINGNTLDNRRSNLRICTHAQNCSNRWGRRGLKYKGISQDGNRFRAQIVHQKTFYYLGSFKTEDEAAKSYDEAAKRLHGEYAVLNFS